MILMYSWLADADMNVKMIDFGLSNYQEDGKMRSTFCGTPAYAAPEMILAQKYAGPEVDVWSLGVVLYAMLSKEFPFKNVADIIHGRFENLSTVSPECSDLLSKMFVVDSNERITLAGIRAHPWIVSNYVRMSAEEDARRGVASGCPRSRPDDTSHCPASHSGDALTATAPPKHIGPAPSKLDDGTSGCTRQLSYSLEEDATSEPLGQTLGVSFNEQDRVVISTDELLSARRRKASNGAGVPSAAVAAALNAITSAKLSNSAASSSQSLAGASTEVRLSSYSALDSLTPIPSVTSPQISDPLRSGASSDDGARGNENGSESSSPVNLVLPKNSGKLLLSPPTTLKDGIPNTRHSRQIARLPCPTQGLPTLRPLLNRSNQSKSSTAKEEQEAPARKSTRSTSCPTASNEIGERKRKRILANGDVVESSEERVVSEEPPPEGSEDPYSFQCVMTRSDSGRQQIAVKGIGNKYTVLNLPPRPKRPKQE